jgi:hypothetical protein
MANTNMNAVKWLGGTILALMLTSNCWGQQYTKLNVKNRVQLDVPADWTINDSEHRKRVTEWANELTGKNNIHIASLSLASYPAPSRMFIRVSFLPLDPPISQAELRQEIQASRAAVMNDLAQMWTQESPAMWEALGKKGIREVGKAAVNLETLGGQTAMVIRYGRTSTANSAETMQVAQYHIPLGAEKALITLSTIAGDSKIAAAHDRIKSTISIR